MTMNCRDAQTRITPLVDGELASAEVDAVAAHLAECPSCRGSADAERFGRRVLRERAAYLATAAPAELRARVRRTLPESRGLGRWRWAIAGAATVAGAVGLVALGGLVQPVPVFAAQATLDHLKCSRLGPQSASSDPRVIEASWKAWQGWDLKVPDGRAAGMRLLGYRRCVLTEGKLAHLLYERGGMIVSLFVIPNGPDIATSELEMFGQDAVLWTSHGRTYALVGHGGRGALTTTAALLERELEAPAVGPGL